jgi:23S rRNA (adenine2030-N6)-methyltransferase
MLSYQHCYHAGSFADLVKHILLARTLEYLTQKESPLFYLETHGGRGIYSLTSPEALKTKEADLGIKRLWQHLQTAPEICQAFFKVMQTVNPDLQLSAYPGSPRFAIEQLRHQDRLYIHELHPQEFKHLKTLGKQQKRVFFSQTDGIKNLKSLLPPPEKRGLIFIDPAYEIKEEYQTIPKAIKDAYLRFPAGTYILWYPIIDEDRHKNLLYGMNKIPSEKNLRIEFDLNPKESQGMHGCGLWIINPPFVLEQEARSLLLFLKKHLGSSETQTLIYKPEFSPSHRPR